MSSWRNIVGYFSKYKAIAIFSIAASSLFEIIDLVVPYTIGQILNVSLFCHFPRPKNSRKRILAIRKIKRKLIHDSD